MNPSTRPSGIRPPTNFKSAYKPYRPSEASTNSTARKGLTLLNSNAISGFKSKITSSIASKGRISNMGLIRKMSFGSAKKSMTNRINLFGMTPQHTKQSIIRPSFSASSRLSQSARRSSIAGKQILCQKDLRPWNDGSFKAQIAAKIITFLNENNYPHRIQTKSFMNGPTQSDVKLTFSFLYGFFDKSVQLHNYSSEIPILMMKLGYPYALKKSDLVTVTGRSIGVFYGILDWLIDCINYGKSVESNGKEPFQYQSFDNESVNIKNELLKLALEGVQNADEIDEKTIKSLENLERKFFGTEDEYENLLDQKNDMERELQEYESKIEEIENFPDVIQKLKREKEEFENYFVKMEDCLTEKREEIEQLQLVEDERKNTLKKLSENKNSLQQQVDEQEFGIDEVQQAYDRKKQLEKQINVKKQIIENLKQENRFAMNKFNELQDEINDKRSELLSSINVMNHIFDEDEENYLKSMINELYSCDFMVKLADKNAKTELYELNQAEDMLGIINTKFAENLRAKANACEDKKLLLEQKKVEKTTYEAHYQKSEEELAAEKRKFEEISKALDDELQSKNEEIEKFKKLQSDKEDNINTQLSQKLVGMKIEFEELKRSNAEQFKEKIRNVKEEIKNEKKYVEKIASLQTERTNCQQSLLLSLKKLHEKVEKTREVKREEKTKRQTKERKHTVKENSK